MKSEFITVQVIATKDPNLYYADSGTEVELKHKHIVYIQDGEYFDDVDHSQALISLTNGTSLIVLGNAAEIAIEIENVS